MAILIAVISWFIGLIGMAMILYRKIPLLRELEAPERQRSRGLVEKIRKRIRKIPLFFSRNQEILLQRTVSKVYIWALRIASQASLWLENSRKNSQARKEGARYWDKVRGTIKRRKKKDAPA